MGIINIFKKGVKQLHSGVDTWVVEWTRRYGQFSSDTAQCYQAFTNEDEAEQFANSIRRAHELIGNTSGTYVSVTKQHSGLPNE
jgi:hypothetical protein